MYVSAQENISTPPTRYVADEIIVKFKPNQIDLKKSSGNKSLQSFATREALITEKIISTQNISVMKINNGQTVDEVIQNLKNDSTIEYVQPNFIYTTQIANPNDTLFATLQR